MALLRQRLPGPSDRLLAVIAERAAAANGGPLGDDVAMLLLRAGSSPTTVSGPSVG